VVLRQFCEQLKSLGMIVKSNATFREVYMRVILIVTLFIVVANSVRAQDKYSKADTSQSTGNALIEKAKEKKITFSGLLLTRYTQSLTNGVDVNGKQNNIADSISTSAFSLRRVRLQARAQVNDRVEATLLLNLSDFQGNPVNKVLEIACVKYHFNDYLNLQAGQFRPYWGKEDMYAEDLLQTLEWSNGYNAFGANGWQSFQVGASVFGEFKNLKIPVKYYVGVFNGNGKNQPADNDNGKLFPARLEFKILPTTTLGINGGVGKDHREKVWAYNFDMEHVVKLSEKLSMYLQSEFRKGINNSLYCAIAPPLKTEPITKYQVADFYVLPNLVYRFNNAQVKSVELSTRYENLNLDESHNGNVRQSIIPMLSTTFAQDYFLRLELGLVIDKYKRDIENTTQYSSTRFICQLQARF
jgi:phosphate-selective porin